MMIDGVEPPDMVRTADDEEAVAALVDALVDQGYMSFDGLQNERLGRRILRHLMEAGFVLGRRQR